MLTSPVLIESEAALENLRRRSIRPEHHFVQDYIEGPSFYYCGLYRDGEKLLSFGQRTLTQQPDGRAVVRAIPFPLPTEIVRKADEMMSSLRWQGLMMMELKESRGSHYAIECNPRVWGPLQLAVDNGADFPFALWRLARGEDPRKGTPPGRRRPDTCGSAAIWEGGSSPVEPGLDSREAGAAPPGESASGTSGFGATPCFLPSATSCVPSGRFAFTGGSGTTVLARTERATPVPRPGNGEFHGPEPRGGRICLAGDRSASRSGIGQAGPDRVRETWAFRFTTRGRRTSRAARPASSSFRAGPTPARPSFE